METISSVLLTGYEELFKIWIGLYKMVGGKKRFKWVDASVVEYTPWGLFEPSHKNGNCAQIYGNDYNYWSLQICTTRQPYLCKMALY
ncbi:regenerating islet-derived protein 4-like [Ahaetulla prasina]|uniref:regenerating islet-derived protein 4-like n=1 Tax=Ahaetulla prasina TaxID=499056 RepID=UPI0026471599|nr:regenerating islet-derived protein 4-like [Ahaetulla prasina]